MLIRVAFISLFFVSTAAFSEMYKCPGKSGSIYQEKPCNGGGKVSMPDTQPNSRDAQMETAISLKEVVIGMTKEQALRSWGKPTKINQTVGQNYTSEQWVYERGSIGRTQYLYFDNGILKSMQGPGEIDKK